MDFLRPDKYLIERRRLISRRKRWAYTGQGPLGKLTHEQCVRLKKEIKALKEQRRLQFEKGLTDPELIERQVGGACRGYYQLKYGDAPRSGWRQARDIQKLKKEAEHILPRSFGFYSTKTGRRKAKR